MSEYQDYQFSQQEIYDEFSMLDSPRFDDRNPLQINFFTDKEGSKELSPTTELHPTTEMKSLIPKQKTPDKHTFSQNQKRFKRVITIDQEQKSKRKIIFKGLKDDTIDLNTNFKTILSKKYKQLALLRQVDSQESTFVQQFIKSVPSFSNMKILCKSEKLKKKGLEFIKSPSLICEILSSSVQMQIKMTMLKYIECLKENFETKEITKWKNLLFQ